MRTTAHLRFLIPSIIALSLPSCTPTEDAASTPESPSPYLYVWAGDADAAEGDSDFLAVVDADPQSPGYGTILGTAPVGSVGNDPHHTEAVAPSEGLLFANGFKANRVFLFDLSSPTEPSFEGEMDPIPGYAYPHSFYRLENSHVIATVQRGDGSGSSDIGALAELGPDGELIRVTSAADSRFEGDRIHPYSLEVFPGIDRVLTSNFSMTLEPTDNVVQLWRLSDLSLLATMPIPLVPAAEEPECFFEQMIAGEDCTPPQIPGHDRPFEIRTLPDGSAILNTLGCGFYRIHGLDTDAPQIDLLLNWPEAVGCAVPTIVGKFEVVPIMFTNAIVTLDVSDPANPVEVARLTMEEAYMPHWTQVDPGTHRIVVSGMGPEAQHVRIYWVDPDTGELTLDQAFGQVDGMGLGLSVTREEWPHGSTGPAIPHAVLFGR